ncbi:MAG: hypothetical protein QM482_04235 [Sulfurospirillum sp.]
MKYLLNIILISFIISFFCACSNNQRTSEILQSNSATIISRDYQDLAILLLKYKKILDLRNPELSNKKLSGEITFDIEQSYDTMHLIKEGSYSNYIKKAFDKGVKNRSDFLILGLYKMFYKAYSLGDGHHMTALGYDANLFKKVYYTLKVLRWKIRNAKDKNGRFIFATWQLNWQLELNKKYHDITIKNVEDLPSLKNGKETLLDHSNFNFEITLSLMIDRVKNSLEALGEEPLNLSISAMKAIILL